MKLAGLKITVLRNALPVYGVLALVPATIRLGYALVTRRQEREARAWALLPLLGAGVAAFHALGRSRISWGMRWRHDGLVIP